MNSSFGKMINKHSESQYLKLEQDYLNLFNFLESLLTITEGEDLDSDTQKLSHFSALCIRVNEGVERFNELTRRVRDVMLNGNSELPRAPGSAEVIVYCSQTELKLIEDALEHMSRSFPDMRSAAQFEDLADNLKNLKGSE